MRIDLDPNSSPTPFPHFWEACIGSCHAATALRADYRRQLERCHRELGFQRVRFHGLLNEDMSVLSYQNGKPRYSFYNIDSIYDYLLSIGMKPFIELGFMPKCLAATPRTIGHYPSYVSPPNDYAAWEALIRSLVTHLCERYGVEEVRSWPFEVWNEPNLNDPNGWLFFLGAQAEYFKLYQVTAQAIKSVDARIRVGGPATAQNAWITALRRFCREENVPLDFISTHHYPTDAAIGFSDMEDAMAHAGRGILKEMAVKARQEADPLPLMYTEWNNSPSMHDPYHEEPYSAAFIIKTITDMDRLADVYSYWTFSDIFEETQMPSAPFYGGFGLLNLYDIAKPSYRAFELLHHLGTERLPLNLETHPTVEALAVQNSTQITLLVFNHHVPRAPIQTEQVSVFVTGNKRATLERIDAQHANAKRSWQTMGCPEYPTNEQIRKMQQASRLVRRPIQGMLQNGKTRFTFQIPPHGVAALVIRDA